LSECQSAWTISESLEESLAASTAAISACLASFNQEARHVECRGPCTVEFSKPGCLERRSIPAQWVACGWRLAPAPSNYVQAFLADEKPDDASRLRHGDIFSDTIEVARQVG